VPPTFKGGGVEKFSSPLFGRGELFVPVFFAFKGKKNLKTKKGNPLMRGEPPFPG